MMTRMIKLGTFIFLVSFTMWLLSGCTTTTDSSVQSTTVKVTATKILSPTKTLTEEREQEILAFLTLLTEGAEYDADNEVLHKYLPILDIRLNNKRLTFIVPIERDEPVEEFVLLGSNLILASALVSEAGRANDWGLSTIDVISPGPSDSSATLYVMGRDNLAKIAKGEVDIYDIMQADVDWGDSTLAKIIVPALNVRSGPGTNYSVIDQVSADDTLTVVGTNATGDWLQVVIDDQGNTGWISGLPEYTQILGSLQNELIVQATIPLPTPTTSRQIDVDRILERIEKLKLTPTPPASSEGFQGCVSWAEARNYIGQSTCVWGFVASTHKSKQAYFINFSKTDYTAFYGVSFEHSWKGLEGTCVILNGLIETYEGRPQIIVEKPNQLQSCTPSFAPAAPAAPTASSNTTSSGFEVPPGKALFVFYNYTNADWNIDIGPYFLQVPARKSSQDYSFDTVAIDPGSYTWQAHSPGGDYYIVDAKGNRAFDFTVAAGEIYEESVR